MGMKSCRKHFFFLRQSASTEPILTLVAQFSEFRNTMDRFYTLTSINQFLCESQTERVTLWYFIWRSKVNIVESMRVSSTDFFFFLFFFSPKPPKIQARAVSILVCRWKPDTGIVCRCLEGKRKNPQTTNSVISLWRTFTNINPWNQNKNESH